MAAKRASGRLGGDSARRVRRWVVLVVLLWLCCPALFAAQHVDAYLIQIKGMITNAYSEAVKRKIEFAAQEGVETVILEMDTPGGYVDASKDLADYIFTRDDMRIIAYINPEAYSGGTMIALACDEIYMDEAVGMMGDVAPIGITGQEAGEKLQSPIRKALENYGAARGYPIALIQAMVSKDMEVYRIKTPDDPAPRYVTGQELDAMSDEERFGIQKELIVPAGHLLTMSAKEAQEYGFAKTVSSRLALYDALKLDRKRVKRLYLSGSERILTFLDALSPLLIVGGIILLYIEISHPGFGLPGILGIACFATFFLVKVSLQYAGMLEVLLFAAGLALLLVEVFITPGFGLLGGIGILLVFVSLVLAFQQFTLPATPGESGAFQMNLLKVIGSLTGAAIGIAVLIRFLPSLPVLGRLIHTSDLSAASVGAAVEERQPGLQRMVGQVGIALTPLRPAGRAEFGDRVLDVVSEGDFIEKGARIQVAAVHGNRFIVKPYRGP